MFYVKRNKLLNGRCLHYFWWLNKHNIINLLFLEFFLAPLYASHAQGRNEHKYSLKNGRDCVNRHYTVLSDHSCWRDFKKRLEISCTTFQLFWLGGSYTHVDEN